MLNASFEAFMAVIFQFEIFRRQNNTWRHSREYLDLKC